MNEGGFRPRPDWWTAVSFGQVPGTTIALVQGSNPDVDTNSLPEDIIPFGGLYGFQTTAVAMQVLSDSANDSAAGTGARTAVVTGLNGSLQEVTETVTLNGLTPVALANNYYRINRFQALTVGSGGVNAGSLVVRTTTGAVPQAQIPAGYGRNQCAVFTVPTGYVGWIVDGFFSMQEFTNSNSYASFQVITRNPGLSWTSRAFVTTSTGAPTAVLQPRAVGPINTGGDLVVRATVVGNSNTQCVATVSVLLTTVP